MKKMIDDLTNSLQTEMKDNNEFKNFIEKFLLSVNNTISEESEYQIELNDKDKLFYEKISSLIDDVKNLTEDSWMNLFRYSSQKNNFLQVTLLSNLYGLTSTKDDDDISLTSSLPDSIDEEIEKELYELKLH
jgi:DNA-binding GntR family transcriptional regulator